MNAVVRLEPPITPRPDQLDALDAILDALARGVRRPLVEAPCAWGKSVLIAMLALALVRRGRRVLILAHRHELLEQNTGALLRLDPAADVGICSASLRSDRLDAAIVVGGTATIFRRLQRLGRVDAVLLDEAHLLGPGSTSMLGTILKSLGDPPLIGFTATPYRTDSGSLISAELFDEIVWRMGIIEAIDAGLLVPLVTKSPKAGRIDTTCVPIERGEFQQRPLEQAALAGSVTRDAVVRTLQVADEENRQSLLFFAIGVAHCAAISAVLREHGIDHAVITGETPTEERADAIARFRAGELRALVNCNVLTTGFDARNIDLHRVHAADRVAGAVDAGRRTGNAHVAWQGRLPPARLRRQHPAPRSDQRDQAAAAGCAPRRPGRRRSRADLPALRRDQRDHHGRVHLVRHGADQAARKRDRDHREHRACDRCRRPIVRAGCACTRCAAASTRSPADRHPSGCATAPRKAGSREFLSLEHEKPGARWYAGKAWTRLSRTPGAPPPATARDAYQRFIGGELREPQRLRIERDGQWWRVVDVERVAL